MRPRDIDSRLRSIAVNCVEGGASITQREWSYKSMSHFLEDIKVVEELESDAFFKKFV